MARDELVLLGVFAVTGLLTWFVAFGLVTWLMNRRFGGDG